MVERALLLSCLPPHDKTVVIARRVDMAAGRIAPPGRGRAGPHELFSTRRKCDEPTNELSAVPWGDIATHLMDMPDLKWDKVEDGKYYLSRAQYDAGNEQV